MEEDGRRLYKQRVAREEQRATPFLHRLKEQTERHRVAEEELLRHMYQEDKERRPLEAKFREEYTTLLERTRTDTISCDAMQGSATVTALKSTTTATESVVAKTSLDLKDEYYERFVYPDDDNREWQDLLSSDSSSLDPFPYRGIRFPFTEISRQRMIYQSNTERLWLKAENNRRNQIKTQTLASLEARHQREKMEFLCHRESRQQRQQQRLRRLAIELNLDVANLPMSALSRLDENVRRQKESQRMQLKRRIDISERLYREQRRMYLESLDLADASKQKVKSKTKKVTVETIIEENIEEIKNVSFDVEATYDEGGEPAEELENVENIWPPPEPTEPTEPIEKFRREVKFDKPLLSELLHMDDWLQGLWADNLGIHRLHPVVTDDLFLVVKPKELVFTDYSPGNTYMRRVLIDNQCYQCATIELQEILFQDDFFRSLFQVHPTESLRLLPGMYVDVTVQFCPNATHMEPFSGALIYSVIRDAKTPLKRLKIGIRCGQTPEKTPANPDVQPRILCFPEAPHWNDKDFHVIFRKAVRFFNRGDEPYFAQVQVFQEPVEEEEPIPQPEETPQEEVEVVSTVTKRSKRAPSKSIPVEVEIVERPSTIISQAITETCTSLIKECAEHPMEVFYWDHLYHINVPGKRFVDVTVHFAPPLPGEYNQTFVVTFHSVTGDILGEARIEVWGKTIPLPLFLSPSEGLDFGVVIAADSMTYQDEFRLQNDSCAAITAVPMIPIHLKQFTEILPRGKVIVNAYSSVTFTLKLYPRRSMRTEARKVYDHATNIMNFLIRVRLCNSSRLGNIPLLTIPVTATILLLDPSWLILTPKMIDLGVVSTSNTVHTMLHLVNTTMIKLDFAILGVPKGAAIQPGYGRGSILPGETLDFDLLYSPRAVDDVPVSGDQVKVFRLRAEPLIAIATNDSSMKNRDSLNDSLSYVMEDQTVIETVHPVSMAEDETGSAADHDVNNIEDDLINSAVDFDSCENTSNTTELTTQRSFNSTKKPNQVECRVLIRDPRCELSVTRLVLPPMPCGSSYIACLQLRTQNMASIMCKCGGVNAAAKIRWRATAFTIDTTGENFEVEPREGSLAAEQFVTVFVKFSPVLSKSEVNEMATAIRIEKIQKLMEEKPKKKGKKTGKKPDSGSEKETDPNEIVIEPEDIKDAEKTLLEVMEPKLMESTILCHVWTNPENVEVDDAERYEELRCQVVAAMIRPDFLLLSDMTIDFGPTAIGAHKSQKIQLQSLTCKRIKVLMSPASPFSPFKVPAVCSYLVEPQHILELPAVFKPEQTGEDCEKFRLTSGKTAVTVRMIGTGIAAQFILKPNFVVCRLEAFPGHPADCSFEVVNDCIASLPLSLRLDFVRQGMEIEPLTASSAAASVSSKQGKKGKPKKEKKSKGKDGKHNLMSDNLTPDETLLLEISEESENPTALFDDSGQLILEPSKKGSFKIHFTPPALPSANLQKGDTTTDSQQTSHKKNKSASVSVAESKATDIGKDSKKGGKKKSLFKILPEELKIVYIAKYSLIVGDLLVLKEFFIIGKQKKGAPPKEKKSKSKSETKKKK